MHFSGGQVAQSVEQGPEKPCVGGSIPSLATFLSRAAAVFLFAAGFVSHAAAEADGAEDAQQWVDSYRAFYHSAQGDHAEAARELASIGEQLKDPDYYGEATREAMLAGDRELAARYGKRRVQLGGGAEARLRYAEVLLYAARWDEAENELASLARDNLLGDEKLFERLRFLPGARAGDVGGRLFSLSATGQEYLARLAVASGDWQLARNAANAGLANNGKRAALYFLRARAAQGEGGEQGAKNAVRELQKYIRDDCPGIADEKACAEAPVFFAYRRLASETEQDWDAPLRTPAEFEERAAVGAGALFELAGDKTNARKHYERFMDDYFFARFAAASMAHNNGDDDKALALLESAKVKNDREFSLREATVASILGKKHGAQKRVERLAAARKTAPDNYRLLYEHSLALEQNGDVDGAIAMLRRMTELFPQDANGWNALGYVLADHNRKLKQAEFYIKRALQMSGEDASGGVSGAFARAPQRADNAHILDSLGWVYYRQGKLRDAEVFLSRAAGLSDNAEIAAHLGEVLWERGRRDDALRVWRAALLRDPDNAVLIKTMQRYKVLPL